MRKLIVFAIAAIVVVIAALGVFVYKQKQKDDKKTPESEEILCSDDIAYDYLNNTVPAIFYIYGSDLPFSESTNGLKLHTKHIDRLNESELYPVEGFECYTLVINDFSNIADLTEEDFEMIDRFIKTTQFHIFYFGNRYMKEFKEHGYWEFEDLPKEALTIQFEYRQLSLCADCLSSYNVKDITNDIIFDVWFSETSNR